MIHFPDTLRRNLTKWIVGLFSSPFVFFVMMLIVSTIGITVIAAIVASVFFGVSMLLSGPFGLISMPFVAEKALYLFSSVIVIGVSVALISGILGMRGTKRAVMRAFNVKVISPETPQGRMVVDLAQAAGLKVPPTVGIYDSDEINAFAAGSSSRDTVVAFSTGLLRQLDETSVNAVAAHEIAHIANKDMHRMQIARSMQKGLVAGFFFAPLKFLLRRTAFFFSELMLRRLSRKREYAADRLGAQLVGAPKMQGALASLAGLPSGSPPQGTNEFNSMKIFGKFDHWFSTHPTIPNRIAALVPEKLITHPLIPYPTTASLLAGMAIFSGMIFAWTDPSLVLGRINLFYAALPLVVISTVTEFFGLKRELLNITIYLILAWLVMTVENLFVISVTSTLPLEFLVSASLAFYFITLPLMVWMYIRIMRRFAPTILKVAHENLDTFLDDANGPSPAQGLSQRVSSLTRRATSALRQYRD